MFPFPPHLTDLLSFGIFNYVGGILHTKLTPGILLQQRKLVALELKASLEPSKVQNIVTHSTFLQNNLEIFQFGNLTSHHPVP